MQAIEFKVVSIKIAAESTELQLEAKAHEYLTSLVFLHMVPSKLAGFKLGDVFTLVEGRLKAARMDLVERSLPDAFEDGSPVPDEEPEVREP